MHVDSRGTQALARELARVVGADGVVTAPEARAVYECDGYTLERAVPDLVALPGSVDEVSAVLRILHRAGVPVVPRGAGTSLSGGCLAVPGAVVVALTRLRAVEELDPYRRQALAQAGVVNLALTRAAEPHGLHYAPDPSSQSACTLGGNIAANSGGPHTLKYGVTVNHVLALELALPDGERVWFGGREPQRGGPDVRGLIVGHEGTFGVVTRAWFRLTPVPPAVRTLLASFAEVDGAAAAVSGLLNLGVMPAAVEMMDAPILEALHDAFGLEFPDGAGAVLLVEVDGPEAGLDAEAAAVEESCRAAGAFEVRRADDAGERKRLWTARKRAFGAIGRLARNYCTQDGVVPRTRLPEVLRRIREIGAAHRIRIANVFHAGDGNLHPVLMFDARVPGESERVLRASEEVLRACLALGGSLTGEHGIGIEKIGLMAEAFGASGLDAMHRVRDAFDPDRRHNPNKLLPGGAGCADPVAWGEARPLGRTEPGRQVPL